MNNDYLIYGKAENCDGIVAVEIKNDIAHLFLEKDNKIQQIQVPNRFWLLANKKLPGKCVKMAGNQFFSWGQQFTSREQFERARNDYKRFGGGLELYSIWNEQESFMVKDGYSFHRGLEMKDVSILSFDIETTGLNFDPDKKHNLLLISNTYRNSLGEISRKLFSYDDYSSEGEMLEDWCSWIREKDPSIVAGHNLFGFDLSFIVAAAKNAGVSLKLGRDGSNLRVARYESEFRKDQTQSLSYKKCYIYGRQIIDTYFLSIKYDIVQKKYDSYGLKQIIEKEGLQEKDRIFYDAGQIRHKFHIPEEWLKIKQYCITDSDDSLKLFDLMAPAFFYLCRSVPKTFQELICSASGSQLNSMFVRSYLQEGHSIPRADEAIKFEGAISFGNPGIYNNAIKWDVSSLYPSIMLQYEIYPENKDPQKNFLKILDYFTNERLLNKRIAGETKSKYHKDLSEAQKIVINSSYGMLGTRGLNFNAPYQAAKVTEIGRDILKKAIVWATGKTYEEWNPEEKEGTEEEVSEA